MYDSTPQELRKRLILCQLIPTKISSALEIVIVFGLFLVAYVFLAVLGLLVSVVLTRPFHWLLGLVTGVTRAPGTSESQDPV